jgi:hypothetical protein
MFFLSQNVFFSIPTYAGFAAPRKKRPLTSRRTSQALHEQPYAGNGWMERRMHARMANWEVVLRMRAVFLMGTSPPQSSNQLSCTGDTLEHPRKIGFVDFSALQGATAEQTLRLGTSR